MPNNRFPKNCWDKNCPHFSTYDMNVDDLLCKCDLLKISCDACAEDFSYFMCPLPSDNQQGVEDECETD